MMRYDENGIEIHDNAELYRLIDAMVLDIQYLEAEVASLRKYLAVNLPQSNITDFLSDLAGYYAEHEAYYDFVKHIHGGVDPLGEGHAANLNKLLENENLSLR